MPWSVRSPPSVAKNWTPSEKKKCVSAANSALRKGKSEREAIFACIAAAGKSKKGKKSTMGSKENAAQQARSKRYRIEIREDGNVTKPAEFATLSDSQFGDPVSYLYAIAGSADATAAKKLFATDSEKYEEGYSVVQVRARLNRLCRKHGVEPVKADEQEFESAFMVGEIHLASPEDADDGRVRIPAARTAVLDHPWWGPIHLDSDLFESFIDNWKTDVVGYRLAIDESHMPEKGALAWFEDVVIEPDDEGKPGLVIYAEKTAAGEVLGDVFKYASIEYREHYIDRETGVDYGPTLMGAAATNRPFVNRQDAMTTLNMPIEDIPQEDRGVHVVFLTQSESEVIPMEGTIEVEDNVGTGETLADGTEVVSLDAIPDPGETPEVPEPSPAPAAQEPVNPDVEVVAMNEPTVAPAETVQVGTVTLTDEDVRGIIAQNVELKATVKKNRVSEVLDKAMGRGVPPVVCDVAKQVLMALEPDASATIQLAAEPGESAKTVNLFDAIAALMDSVPGRGGEVTLTNVGEKPTEKPATGNPYVDDVELTAEEAEEEARNRREALGINAINQPNEAAL